MTISEALQWAHESLILSSDSARLDAELLLSHVLGRPATFLLAHDEQKISSINHWKYKRLIRKRKEGMPVAYLTGHKEFFMLDFEVNKQVLIPRPDTEILVDAVIQYLRSEISDLRSVLLLDVGTGSACIPIAVLSQVENLKAVATDVSKKALKLAERNAARLHFKKRLTLIHSDLLKDVPTRLFKGHELIVTANLPYLTPFHMEVNPDLRFEPHLALHGGGEGLDIYKRLIEELRAFQPRAIFLELFESQIAILKNLLPDYRLKYVKTMTGQARVMVMEKTI